MNNLEWFTGNEMPVEKVAEMTVEEIADGVEAIGVEPEVDVRDLAQEIHDLAQKAG
jgi:hypothetical protein